MSGTRRQTINFGSFFTQKKCWTAEEDQLLIATIAELGHSQWPNIASRLPGRTGKQCRERWHNHLQDGIVKSEWTAVEDRIIVALQSRFGNQWAKIAKCFYGRSDNAIKNRFHVNERNIRNGTSVAYSDSDQTLNELLAEYWQQYETGNNHMSLQQYSLDDMDEMPDNKSRKIASSSTDDVDANSLVVEASFITGTSSDEFDTLCRRVQYNTNNSEVVVVSAKSSHEEDGMMEEDFTAGLQRERSDKSVDTNSSNSSNRKSFNSTGSNKIKRNSSKSDKSDDSTSSKHWNIFSTMSPVTSLVNKIFQNDNSNNTCDLNESQSTAVKRKTFMSYFSGDNS